MTTTAERRPAAEPDGAHTRKKLPKGSAPVPSPSSLTYEERIAAAQARRVAAGLAPLGPPRDDQTGETIPAPAGTTNIAGDPRDWAQTQHSRVYRSIETDPKFATVYHDDALLATWLRLLLAADTTWPVAARIPRQTDQIALDSLAGVGLVNLLPNDLYLVHGLDAERKVRAAQGTPGGKRRAEEGVRDLPSGRWLPNQRTLAPTQRTLDDHPARAGGPPASKGL